MKRPNNATLPKHVSRAKTAKNSGALPNQHQRCLHRPVQQLRNLLAKPPKPAKPASPAQPTRPAKPPRTASNRDPRRGRNSEPTLAKNSANSGPNRDLNNVRTPGKNRANSAPPNHGLNSEPSRELSGQRRPTVPSNQPQLRRPQRRLLHLRNPCVARLLVAMGLQAELMLVVLRVAPLKVVPTNRGTVLRRVPTSAARNRETRTPVREAQLRLVAPAPRHMAAELSKRRRNSGKSNRHAPCITHPRPRTRAQRRCVVVPTTPPWAKVVVQARFNSVAVLRSPSSNASA
jgi:hypothetical protein